MITATVGEKKDPLKKRRKEGVYKQIALPKAKEGGEPVNGAIQRIASLKRTHIGKRGRVRDNSGAS